MGRFSPFKRRAGFRRPADGRRLRLARRVKLSAGNVRTLLAIICAATSLTAVVWTTGAQSGRKKSDAPPPASGRRGTVAAPAQTPTPEDGTAPPRAVVREDPEAEPPPYRTPEPEPQVHRTQPTATPDEIDDGDVVRVSSNLVPVPATVVDREGRAVLDLDLKDFELRVDGQVRPIGDLSRAETPVTMAFLYDNSSSLRAGREFEKKAAVAFLRRVLRPIDRASIFSISTSPEMALPLTSDVRALVRAVENFGKPEGATALFDAVAEAARYLKPHAGRKVIVIVSDGTDTISSLEFDETLRRLIASDCQVYAVQTGHSENTNLRDLAGERRLQEYAASTGGAVYAPRTSADFDVAFDQIAAALAQQYVLSYYPSDERRDGRFHAISLRVSTRPALRVNTRKGYYSPKG